MPNSVFLSLLQFVVFKPHRVVIFFLNGDLMHNTAAWINIQRAQQSMHALEFFISTSRAILSRKGLCD
jgi:hypothetical protein